MTIAQGPPDNLTATAVAADRLYERLLVLRCQAGDDAAAFEELVGCYGPRLRFYLRKMVGGDAHRAEDVLQDVWFDVFRGITRLNDPAALATWLYRIARDRAYRELRRRRVPHQPIETVEAELTPTARDDSPDDREFTPEDAGRVHAALDRLAPEHREALVLRFVQQMSYEQIADVTGRPVGTVRSRLHYARRALRAALSDGSNPP